MLSNVSLLALALMLAAVGVGLRKRALSSGALILANLGVFALISFGPSISRGQVGLPVSTILA